MKIAQVCSRYHPFIGGIETHVREISEKLVKKGHSVDVLTCDPSRELAEEEIINNVRVKRFKSWAPHEAYYFSRTLKNHLMECSDNYDVVHAHDYGAFPALYAARAKSKNELVFTPHYHGTGHTLLRSLLHIPYKLLGERIFREADKIICVSNSEKGLIVSHFRVSEKEIEVIPNGVNLEEFRGLQKKRKKCRSVLCVGRLEKYKGIQYLIRVLPLFERDVVLEIVGRGPYEESLVKLARKLNVTERVNFSQGLPRRELLQKYVDTDVFVLLSKHEAYGLSVAEALCAGSPCIVANTSALSEWVDGRNCLGIDYPININVLKDLILSSFGVEVTEAKICDWDEVTERIVHSYETCLEGDPP